MFEDKKILLISVSFFNYELIIKNKLQQRGATVDFFDERPSNSIFIKGLLRIQKNAYSQQIRKYYNKILSKIKNRKYDYFLLIKGEVIPDYFIDQVRILNPGIKMIYYNYDSFHNNPNALRFLELFDYKFTFDQDDAKLHNLSFRPLFYADDYKKIRLEDQNTHEYNISFIGTAHSDRYLISEKVNNEAKKLNLNHFAYYYSQGKIVFLYKKLFDHTFKKFDYKKLSFRSLTHSEIIDIYRKADVILDIHHPGQKGLTMRTFEALGAGKKLITTNKEVKKYSFFNSQNILIIDRENVSLDPVFFKEKTKILSEELLYRMSIDGWIDEVFGAQEKIYYWLEAKR